MSRSIDWQALLAAARAARAHAHAPYSRFAVGAAVLAADGRIYAGCNVENASYGLSMCAERNALAAAIAAGARSLRAVAVIAPGPPVATPCGACRQVLAELAPRAAVLCASLDGRRLRTSVSSLLPRAFGRRSLATR
ncbi:MAG: cytidine deaminase [Myxococcota bacterium]|nr:cytidine deaminase [Myxococcota bacterium]MDW8363728.1 cytidine deaminase [Myxococcales bacterium]